MRKLFLGVVAFFLVLSVKADEGMWMLKELNEVSVARMQELGFTFPADSVYSESNPSLKDAVVIFGGGCTGVVVSEKGLIFTNHHCGFGAIQKLSSVQHDYLKDGYASQTFEQELPAEGLQISFLKKTEDITVFVTADVKDTDTEEERGAKIQAKSDEYLKKYEGNEFLSAKVVPFYSRNKYYVVVYEIFKDIRLVFTPPTSVGKFGGDTDNWMWPRHTGDFSVFRVYANNNNEATTYSADNVPYTPKYAVPVSIKGYEQNNYAMTIGFPGSTERYISSYGINQKVESEHKPRIEVRGEKQAIWKAAMNADDAIRIKYASKHAMSSNYWKNAMGMNEAIAKLKAIESKEQIETQFSNWVSQDASRKAKYENTLPSMQKAYASSMEIVNIRTYFFETFYNGIEMVKMASTAQHVAGMNIAQGESDKATNMQGRLASVYKDYDSSLDQAVMPVLLEIYAKRVPAQYLPSVYTTINKKFKGDYKKYAEWFYKNTKLSHLDSAIELVANGKAKDMDKDPAIIFAKSLDDVMKLISIEMKSNIIDIAKGNRLYMAGLMEMEPNKAFSPDANFTQRLSYGSVSGYKPADAVDYNYYSTTQGILDKEVAGDPEFNVQGYILDAIKQADFGRYAAADGKMYVNFLSNNDITGGNSGSPVFNSKAELMGLAFDGNWEALSGDIIFNKDVQRCINVDIRYVLYTIDKVMNCPRIIDELKIVN